ncbi:Bro-N domain-containing protein [Pseudomonas sp. NA-150]|uniref:BRO-N domain-containing protein n=1 Tax=Pseudomonas sp. NA-150 TaxID=3367525 RepID=UPI0037CB113C
MESPHQPHVFTRHKLKLHALIIERQAWFCTRDLGRLMGMFFEDRITRKLDTDQRRVVTLEYYGELKDMQMISESAVYAMLIYHHHPENFQLRRWLTYQVLPVLRESHMPTRDDGPTPGVLEWRSGELRVLHWQDEPWIRLRDMPSLLPGRGDVASAGGWWGIRASRLLSALIGR